MIRIDEKTFNRLYPDMVGRYKFFADPVPASTTLAEFNATYMKSKLWRLNNLYTVVNKDGEPVRFRMNLAQHIVYSRARMHPRVIILKSRQQGISTFWLVCYFDDGVFCPFLNIGMMAQGVDEASTLLERSKFLWDKLPQPAKDLVGVGLDKDNSKEFAFTNQSTIFIRTSFRSTTLQRLHVSEMGKIANNYPQRAKEVKTGTLQALAKGNTGIIESTAEGLNMFKEMWDAAELALHSGQMSFKDFHPVFLSWLDDPDCLESVSQVEDTDAINYFKELEAKTERQLTKEQKNFWIVQRRELGGDIHQEYPATAEEAFTAARDGTFWSRQFNEEVVRRGNVIAKLWDRNLPVDVYVDIGVEDYGVLVFKQWYRGEYRVIDEYWNQNYDMAHYMDEAMSRGYDIRKIMFPHDVRVREYAGGNAGKGGRTRTRLNIAREKAKNEGWKVIIGTVTKSAIADGIEGVRRIIPKLKIDPKCEYLIKCFQRYTKEWDMRLSAWKQTEVHDEYSHGAAAIRYMAVDSLENKVDLTPQRQKRNTSYSI